ncbi:MAG: DHA2 family efflux MFS transporter permease subunit [Proteobacteria bacterium]|nr:DHA2 family efflux MFS transporter permease subunit [Pseudomonadota bacterium]
MSAAATTPIPLHDRITPGIRTIITICVMLATLMQALDSTIANVALPYMQGTLSANSDQINWVLTSYVVAAAIMTAPVGWLSARFGAKNVLLVSLVGFTVTSMLCGIAGSIGEMVIFRFLQGVFGAALVPLSQSTLLNIYPLEQRGPAMSIWGMGVMLGPILGPTLGGYLTDFYNWRYVFFVNLPFGIAATLGLIFFMKDEGERKVPGFDWTGFAILAIALAGLQLALDRGETKDWFGSDEIIAEALLAGLGFYLFTVHMLTSKKPLLPKGIFTDRNMLSAILMMFLVGLVLLSSSALLAPYLQKLSGYSVRAAGLEMAPRGFGTMAAMLICGRIGTKIDVRLQMLVGIVLLVLSLYWMTLWTPDVSSAWILTVIVVQGAGIGLVFMPLQLIAFATLSPTLRGDGAAAMSLTRNIGMAIGTSVTAAIVTQMSQYEHAVLSYFVTPFAHVFTSSAMASIDPTTAEGAQRMSAMIDRQASIIGYGDAFKALMLSSVPCVFLLFLMRKPKVQPKADPSEAHVAMD